MREPFVNITAISAKLPTSYTGGTCDQRFSVSTNNINNKRQWDDQWSGPHGDSDDVDEADTWNSEREESDELF